MAEAALDLRGQRSAQLKTDRQSSRHSNKAGVNSGLENAANIPSANESPRSPEQHAAKLQEVRGASRRESKSNNLQSQIGANAKPGAEQNNGKQGRPDPVALAEKKGDQNKKSDIGSIGDFKKASKESRNLFWENMRTFLDRWWAAEALATFAGDPIPTIVLNIRAFASTSWGKGMPFLRELRYTETSFLKAIVPSSSKMRPFTFTPRLAIASALFMDFNAIGIILLALYAVILPVIHALEYPVSTFFSALFSGTGLVAPFLP